MKRALFFLLSLAMVSAVTSAGVPTSGPDMAREAIQPPQVDDTGGPDIFGYTWIDSNEPGGPAVHFIDISGFGTEVEGLGDDNFVGPFPIGFSFHFYWYDVTQFWVGSNGWMKFSTAGQLAQPLPHIPVATPPNDLLCPVAADWLFEPGGAAHAYYWSNNVDTCIVAWHDVPGWNTGGSHDFEVILSAVDSNITFQYGEQTGTVSNNSIVVGIENSTGMIGLEVLYGVLPAANYAVLFDYPAEITYEVHDMSVAAVMNEETTGMFSLVDTDVGIWCRIKNSGNQDESTCTVTAEVQNLSGQVQWTATEVLTGMTAGEEREILFSTPWTTPGTAGTFKVEVEVDLDGDMNPGNDVFNCELGVVTLTGTLGYDDGSYERSWGWEGGNGGMGCKFLPPNSYPIQINEISLYFPPDGTVGLNHDLQIIDDDGGNGYPGSILWEQSVAPMTLGGWNYYTVSPPVEILSGDFYLGLIQYETSNSFAFDNAGIDPESRTAWEFTGVWAPFREQANHEYMIHCRISGSTPAVETTNPSVITYRLLENYPNPFNPMTTIRYSTTQPGVVTLKVFDVTGRLVNTLVNAQMPEGIHRIAWNGRDSNGNEVSTGVYFYTIETPGSNTTAKMMLIK